MKSAPRRRRQRPVCRGFRGRVVIHPVVAQHAAVAVGGIFAEAGIGHDDHLRHRGLTNPRHTRHQTIFIPGIAAGGIGVMRNTKGHHRADPGVGDAFDLRAPDIFPECASRRAWPRSLCNHQFLLRRKIGNARSFKLSVVSSNRARSAAD